MSLTPATSSDWPTREPRACTRCGESALVPPDENTPCLVTRDCTGTHTNPEGKLPRKDTR